MDDLAAHTAAGARQGIETGAHLRSLPACSPDVDSIGQACAELAALLRPAAARTVPDP